VFLCTLDFRPACCLEQPWWCVRVALAEQTARQCPWPPRERHASCSLNGRNVWCLTGRPYASCCLECGCSPQSWKTAHAWSGQTFATAASGSTCITIDGHGAFNLRSMCCRSTHVLAVTWFGCDACVGHSAPPSLVPTRGCLQLPDCFNTLVPQALKRVLRCLREF
jgi:hypothetical protein